MKRLAEVVVAISRYSTLDVICLGYARRASSKICRKSYCVYLIVKSMLLLDLEVYAHLHGV